MKTTASIVLVAFNEGPVVRSCLDKITCSAESQSTPFEILAVNNGSTDNTFIEMQAWQSAVAPHSAVQKRVLDLPVNLRFSGGLLAGVAAARSDWVMSYSADILFSGEDLERFLRVVSPGDNKPLEEIARIGAVVGERSQRPGYPFHVRVFSSAYNTLLRVIFGVPLRDFNWVCLYQRKLLQQLPIHSRSIFFHAEILIRMKRLGFELPAVYAPVFARAHGKATVSKPATWFAVIEDFCRFLISKGDAR